MKHAYLILAHNELEVLQNLVTALDDARNDIFIHLDKKVKSLPCISTTRSRLVWITNRIETAWGDTSLMRAEISLMKTAVNSGDYACYHIISGVHYPLKSQDFIHDAFDGNSISHLTLMQTDPQEEKFKIGRYHHFVKGQSPKGTMKERLCNLLWRIVLRFQRPFKGRDISFLGGKASQWCSLNSEAVRFIVDNKERAYKLFNHTFCCDEFFVPAMLKLGNLPWTDDKTLLYAVFGQYSPRELTDEDYDAMVDSGCVFARKMGKHSLSLIDRIDNHIHSVK